MGDIIITSGDIRRILGVLVRGMLASLDTLPSTDTTNKEEVGFFIGRS